ncbi:MAG: hypothetical protein SFT93_00305 [Rickettsiaceae bacterium]|nr:hypothetical protein [Rickettsiaceae bacterium]
MTQPESQYSEQEYSNQHNSYHHKVSVGGPNDLYDIAATANLLFSAIGGANDLSNTKGIPKTLSYPLKYGLYGGVVGAFTYAIGTTIQFLGKMGPFAKQAPFFDTLANNGLFGALVGFVVGSVPSAVYGLGTDLYNLFGYNEGDKHHVHVNKHHHYHETPYQSVHSKKAPCVCEDYDYDYA